MRSKKIAYFSLPDHDMDDSITEVGHIEEYGDNPDGDIINEYYYARMDNYKNHIFIRLESGGYNEKLLLYFRTEFMEKSYSYAQEWAEGTKETLGNRNYPYLIQSLIPSYISHTILGEDTTEIWNMKDGYVGSNPWAIMSNTALEILRESKMNEFKKLMETEEFVNKVKSIMEDKG